MLSMPEDTLKPQIGKYSTCIFNSRALTLYRMPSSSRAYPLALEKKSETYYELFKQTGLVL